MISRSQHVLPRTVERFRHHACPNINFVKKCVPFHLWGCANYHSSSPTFDGMPVYHGTTILCVRKNGKVCMIGDGQVSKGSVQVKPNAKKIRVFDTREGVQKTLVGFAGATADAFALLDLLEKKIEEHPGQLVRSCVDLAKGWRTDKILRPLSASLLVADADVSLEVTGYGDVIEYNDGILGIGSGSDFAIGMWRIAA